MIYALNNYAYNQIRLRKFFDDQDECRTQMNTDINILIFYYESPRWAQSYEVSKLIFEVSCWIIKNLRNQDDEK